MSGDRRRAPVPSTYWTKDALEADRKHAIVTFRRERLEEPVENYGVFFDGVKGVIEDLLESTVDLSLIDEQAVDILSERASQIAFRYLAGPPISEDDLKTLVDTNSLARSTLERDPDLVTRVIETVLSVLDRRRFPWVWENRQPTPSERDAAILATASLAAMRGAETKRRTQGKAAQESAVRQVLLETGFIEVSLPNATAPTLAQAPRPGEFCKEATLAGRKADLIVGLWDHRIMPIECKVSNSSLNSIKRLNNDAAAKAEGWLSDLGKVQIVPVAVLSGVYGLNSLESAQQRGLTLYWAHRLDDLTDWIKKSR